MSKRLVFGGGGPFRIADADRGFIRERFVSGRIELDCRPDSESLAALADALKGRYTHLRLYGATESLAETITAALDVPSLEVAPFSSPTPGQTDWAGVLAYCIKPGDGTKVQRRSMAGGATAWFIESGDIRMCYLMSVCAADSNVLDAYDATYRDTFAKMKESGFAPAQVARTWCYFKDVLDDYDGFNHVRTGAFEDLSIKAPKLPASTGIQGIPTEGRHLLMDALAYSGKGVELKWLHNPTQCDASDYGSMFSRGVTIKGAGLTQIIISGMASIGLDGATILPEDPVGQVEETITSARKFLQSQGLDWENVAYMIAYFRPEHFEAMEAKMRELTPADLPVTPALATVCRDDLWYEIEFLAYENAD